MKTVVMLPTYEEAGNIGPLIEGLYGLGVPGLDVLVMDDRSPDGTAKEAAGLKARFPGLRVVERSGPAGRGLAGREGFLRALEAGADLVVEMDADLSHQPSQVPRLLEAMAECDVAIGSRMTSGGEDRRSAPRRALTGLSAAYARLLLGLDVRDANSGFRCFRRSALEAIEPAALRSQGPSIVHEVLFRAARRGLRIREVPIEFAPRGSGRSKLDLPRLAAGWLWILRLRLGL